MNVPCKNVGRPSRNPPRRPTYPLAVENVVSDCPTNSGVKRRSTHRQSSIGKMNSGGRTGSCRIMIVSPECWRLRGELAEVVHDRIRAVLEQRSRVPLAVHADHEPEVP